MLGKPSRSTFTKALGLCGLLLAAFALFSGLNQPPLDASTKAAVADQRPVNTIVNLVKTVSPAVVNITTKGETRPAASSRRFGQPLPDAWRRFFQTPPFSMPGPFGMPGTPRAPRKTEAFGSGVIIDSKGLILTNHHVVAGRKNTTITVALSDENEFEGTIIGSDEKSDVALIQINAGYALPTAPLGDSDKLEIGEGVLAIGNPFGLDRTVTSGIVSAKGRRIGGPYDNFIQTDASINPGNSGGPLINHRGEVVGVNTAIYSRGGGNVGIGFAIPINIVKELLPQLRDDGRVTRGWLGVAFQKMTPLLAESLGIGEPRGALVAEVLPDTPAQQGGFKPGDVIVEFDEIPVNESGDLPMIVARTPVGKEVGVKVLRKGDQETLTVRIGKLKDASVVATPSEDGSEFGLTVREVTPDTAKKLSLKRAEGVVVTAVKPGSPAEEAGLRQGDVILEVNRNPVKTLAAYRQAVKQLEKGRNVLLLVQRGEMTRFFVAKS